MRYLLPIVRSWLAVLAMTIAHNSFAAETLTLEGCTDASGKTVPAEADYGLPVLVRSGNGGSAGLRYNPALLPDLSANARQFFYAHECAKHVLGLAGKTDLTQSQIQRADCVATAALVASGLIKRDDLPQLENELRFDQQSWPLLPGPPRAFALASCRSTGVLALPAPSPPSAQQNLWNTCVRGCADRLWTCQKACRGEACTAACADGHSQCEAACGSVGR